MCSRPPATVLAEGTCFACHELIVQVLDEHFSSSIVEVDTTFGEHLAHVWWAEDDEFRAVGLYVLFQLLNEVCGYTLSVRKGKNDTYGSTGEHTSTFTLEESKIFRSLITMVLVAVESIVGTNGEDDSLYLLVAILVLCKSKHKYGNTESTD